MSAHLQGLGDPGVAAGRFGLEAGRIAHPPGLPIRQTAGCAQEHVKTQTRGTSFGTPKGSVASDELPLQHVQLPLRFFALFPQIPLERLPRCLVR